MVVLFVFVVVVAVFSLFSSDGDEAGDDMFEFSSHGWKLELEHEEVEVEMEVEGVGAGDFIVGFCSTFRSLCNISI